MPFHGIGTHVSQEKYWNHAKIRFYEDRYDAKIEIWMLYGKVFAINNIICAPAIYEIDETEKTYNQRTEFNEIFDV